MLKYENYDIVFMEIPKKVSLAINITNCQNNCKNCHSPQLRDDIGKELTILSLNKLLEENKGIECVIFMGEGNDQTTLLNLAKHIRLNGLIVALYSGREKVEENIYLNFDYIKIGSYKEEFGPLNKETTNQRLYKIILNSNTIKKIDITSELYKKCNKEDKVFS
jgi:anaerobic ribonucleoside-triphosphate reductase activating protein